MTPTTASLGRADALARPRSRSVPLRGLALAGIPVALLMALSTPLALWVNGLDPALYEPWRIAGLASVLALGGIGMALLAGMPRGLDRGGLLVLGAPAIMAGVSLVVHGAVLFLAANLPSGVGTLGQMSPTAEAIRGVLDQSRTLPAVLALGGLIAVALQARSWQADSPAPRSERTSPLLPTVLAGLALLGGLAVALVPTLLARHVLPLAEAARFESTTLGGMTGSIAETTTGIALLLGVALTASAARGVRTAAWVLLGLLGAHLLLERLVAHAERLADPSSELGQVLRDALPALQVWGFLACAGLGAAILVLTLVGERR